MNKLAKMSKMGKMVPQIVRLLGQKTDTTLYPAVKLVMKPRFRGALKFRGEKCVGCKLCMRVCPANAIEIVKVADKQYKAIVRMDKCLFCGQCVDSCNKDALYNSPEFELACADKASLVREI